MYDGKDLRCDDCGIQLIKLNHEKLMEYVCGIVPAKLVKEYHKTDLHLCGNCLDDRLRGVYIAPSAETNNSQPELGNFFENPKQKEEKNER